MSYTTDNVKALIPLTWGESKCRVVEALIEMAFTRGKQFQADKEEPK